MQIKGVQLQGATQAVSCWEGLGSPERAPTRDRRDVDSACATSDWQLMLLLDQLQRSEMKAKQQRVGYASRIVPLI